MGDLVDINEWVEKKVNVLAQKFRGCRDTTRGKELECVLKEWGHKMAKYKTHYARQERERTQRAQEREQNEKTLSED
jgi:hypothetical protein